MRERKGEGMARGVVVALTALLALSATAAEEGVWVALDAGRPAALGAAWDARHARALGGGDTCIRAVAPERTPLERAHYELVVLSRAGGRLLLGVHAAVTLEREALPDVRLSDAAHRLAYADAAAFRALCGDAFLAARAWGAQLLVELEVDPDDARRTAAWLETSRAYGVRGDPEQLVETIDWLFRRYRVSARELPAGSRARALAIEPTVLIERLKGFRAAVTAASAVPFLGRTAPWSSELRAGAAASIEVDEPGGLATAAFASLSRTGSRRASAALAAPRVAAPPPVVRISRAWSLESAGGVVYATREPPPGGVFSERAGLRHYWEPGAAAATPALRARLGDAASAEPDAHVDVRCVRIGTIWVHVTPARPRAGVFAARTADGWAWIAGVATPTRAERAA
ncbi:MAG: hypothetical protein QNK03_17310, partial [Myxococcota bacterium]|nr:hypothetical protein [Myxococcota bacterium]